jgi:anthranilate synthase/aminodeoxychorismate synthase-like glutamine amidotransferase
MIDNYDSFTYNLVQYLGELGAEIRVFRNDKITIPEIKKLNPERIVISVDVVKEFSGKIPILGVCLGHQSIGAAFGGKIVNAPRLMHGKTSLVHHDGKTIFHGLPNPFEATRYHSLIIKKETLPASFEITAWTDREEIMGIRHRELIVEGVQFHPESILTKVGHDLLQNFLRLKSS